MTHRIPLLVLVLLIGYACTAQKSLTVLGQVTADSTFERAMLHVNVNGVERSRTSISRDGRFRVSIPEEADIELTLVSETHMTERIEIDTHNAYCDAVSTPLNEKFKVSFTLFPSSIAENIAFQKPYASISFVEGTGRRIFEHNAIEVNPADMGDFAEQIER